MEKNNIHDSPQYFEDFTDEQIAKLAQHLGFDFDKIEWHNPIILWLSKTSPVVNSWTTSEGTLAEEFDITRLVVRQFEVDSLITRREIRYYDKNGNLSTKIGDENMTRRVDRSDIEALTLKLLEFMNKLPGYQVDYIKDLIRQDSDYLKILNSRLEAIQRHPEFPVINREYQIVTLQLKIGNLESELIFLNKELTRLENEKSNQTTSPAEMQ